MPDHGNDDDKGDDKDHGNDDDHNLLHGEDDHDDGILSGFHVSGSTICSPHNQVPKLAAGLQDFHSEKCRQFSLSPNRGTLPKDSGSSLDPDLQILDISTDSVDDFHLSQSLSDGTRSRTHTCTHVLSNIFSKLLSK